MNKGYYHLCTGGELLANKLQIAHKESLSMIKQPKERLGVLAIFAVCAWVLFVAYVVSHFIVKFW